MLTMSKATAATAFRRLGIKTEPGFFEAAISARGGFNQRQALIFAKAIKYIASHSRAFEGNITPLGVEANLVNFCLTHQSRWLDNQGLKTALGYAPKTNPLTPEQQARIELFQLSPAMQKMLTNRFIESTPEAKRLATRLASLRRQLPALKAARSCFDPAILTQGSTEMQALAADQEKMGLLLAAAKSYQLRAALQNQLSIAGSTRQEKINSLLAQHPAVKKTNGQFAIPLGLLMDIANQSDVGIYTSGNGDVVKDHNNSSESQFITLAYCNYWRSMMQNWAIKIAERFYQSGTKTFDLVMVGDGSGQLGAALGQALSLYGEPFRIIHLDISQGLLRRQYHAYLEAGLAENQIKSIQGSVTNAPTLINNTVPDFDGGFFVLHEVIDDLRTHGLFIDSYQGTGELYYIHDRSTELSNKEIHDISDPSIATTFPLFTHYQKGKGPRLMPFSLEYPLALNAILECGPKIALYVGDYASRFVFRNHRLLPLRLCGRTVTDSEDFSQVFTKEANLTADVDPAILHLASAWGGKVERLTTQDQFLSEVDPSLPGRITTELARIEGLVNSGGYSLENASDFSQDQMLILQIIGPQVFAGLVTKGL